MSHSKQKIGRFKFLVLQGYQDKDGSIRKKKRRSSFIMYVKESRSVSYSVLIQSPLFTPRTFCNVRFLPRLIIYIDIYSVLNNFYFFSFLFSFFFTGQSKLLKRGTLHSI